MYQRKHDAGTTAQRGNGNEIQGDVAVLSLLIAVTSLLNYLPLCWTTYINSSRKVPFIFTFVERRVSKINTLLIFTCVKCNLFSLHTIWNKCIHCCINNLLCSRCVGQKHSELSTLKLSVKARAFDWLGKPDWIWRTPYLLFI